MTGVLQSVSMSRPVGQAACAPGEQPLRVLIADDHALVRAAIRALLANDAGIHVVGETRDGLELLDRLDSCAADVVLCDLNMPGMDGIECLEHLRTRHPDVRVLILSADGSPEAVRMATRRGATGYIVKDSATAELALAVRTVGTGQRYISSSLVSPLIAEKSRAPEDLLTPRQIEVLTLVAQGHGSIETGKLLGLSPKTVDMHRANIMRCLEVRDIAGLTRYAMRHRLIK